MSTAKLIAIDAGNTRIKWGVHDGAGWVARGALPTGEAARLSEQTADWPRGAQVLACNVAGASVEGEITKALAGRFAPVCWLRSGAEACGVRNAYEDPGRLGADRWAALIGARAQVNGACLVVCAGTATTVDWLDAEGVFRGGLILPDRAAQYGGCHLQRLSAGTGRCGRAHVRRVACRVRCALPAHGGRRALPRAALEYFIPIDGESDS